MDLKLKGKVAMVAASSKGLGYGIAQALAKEGASLSIGSRTENDIYEAAEKITNETGAPVLANILDSSNLNSIQKWNQATIKEYGGIDKLVVNASASSPNIGNSVPSFFFALWKYLNKSCISNLFISISPLRLLS